MKHIVILSIVRFSLYAESNSPVESVNLKTFFADDFEDIIEDWRNVCQNIESLGYFLSAETALTVLFPDGNKEEYPGKSPENQVFENILRERFTEIHF